MNSVAYRSHLDTATAGDTLLLAMLWQSFSSWAIPHGSWTLLTITQTLSVRNILRNCWERAAAHRSSCSGQGTDWASEKPQFKSRLRRWIYIFSKKGRPFLGPTYPPTEYVPKTFPTYKETRPQAHYLPRLRLEGGRMNGFMPPVSHTPWWPP
jgi:hypothetical protein